MVHLKGMTWDHPRGYDPLVACTNLYQKLHPDFRLEWDVRSLRNFGEQPIELLVQDYDLILLDHPFIGTGVRKGLISPINDFVPDHFLKDQKQNSVGLSYQSYTWDGMQWALPIDAASQVAAYRKDLISVLPNTWNEVFDLIYTLPENLKVGIPLVSTDCICCFLSLCANMGGAEFWSKETGIDMEAGSEALVMLKNLVPLIHEKSLEMNPINMLDHMAERDEIAYIPLTFGYSNYARRGYAKNILNFSNVPSTSNDPSGALLGGVGIAVSSYSKAKQAAADFIAFACRGDIQKGLYFESGGQPGYRTAWTDSAVNDRCSGFFRDTLETLDQSYLRPRYPGYHVFQEKAGEMIHQFLKTNEHPKDLVVRLNQLIKMSERG